MIVIKISQKKAEGILIQFKYKQMVFLDFIQHVSSISFNVFLSIVRITNLRPECRLQNWLDGPIFTATCHHDLRDVNPTALLALRLALGNLAMLLPRGAGMAQSRHVLRK